MNAEPSTLVLLPGLGCDAEVWADLLPALCERGPLWVSDLHFRHDSLEAMAEALLRELDGPLLLCGASMGGMLALEVGRRAPERVRGMALLGSSAEPDTPARQALRLEGIRRMRQGEFDALMQENLPYSFHASRLTDAALSGRFLAMLARCGAPELIRQNEWVARRPDQRALLTQLRCPVLLVCGEADQVTPPAQSAAMAAAIPQAELHLLPRCGHMLTLEQPAAVSALLQDWLSRCCSAPV